MKVYVETSVWSFALANDVPDYRRDTESFFERYHTNNDIEPFISDVVIKELKRANDPLRGELLAKIQTVQPVVLDYSEATGQLAEEFVRHGAVPPSKPDDAAHVAYSFVNGMDVLVSWNFRHIVNVRREQRFNAIAQLHGYNKPLEIASPAEMSYDDQSNR